MPAGMDYCDAHSIFLSDLSEILVERGARDKFFAAPQQNL